VHDFYRRFIRRDAPERHYVNAGRACTVLLYIVAGFLALLWNPRRRRSDHHQHRRGTGLLYLLRWLWWRINAWCEIVAMASSFIVSVTFFILGEDGHGLPFARRS
jgi:Na+(H+)/acetate symporter ActP